MNLFNLQHVLPPSPSKISKDSDLIKQFFPGSKKVKCFCSQCGGEFETKPRLDGKVFGFSSCKEHKGLKNLDEDDI